MRHQLPFLKALCISTAREYGSKMFVSVSRVKPFLGTGWNSQVSLFSCSYPDTSRKRLKVLDLSFSHLKSLIQHNLSVNVGEAEKNADGKDRCLAWSMSGSDQLGRVYDDGSFQSAVVDHRSARKIIVQLYIIEDKGRYDRARYRYPMLTHVHRRP